MSTPTETDFRQCKYCRQSTGVPRYKIKNAATIYVCTHCGFHYLDHLDDLDRLPPAPADEAARRRHHQYIEGVLQYSSRRFLSKVELLERHTRIRGSRCLDVGAGAGLFLHWMQQRGAAVYGIEPDRNNAEYASERYGFSFDSRLVEHPFWQGTYREFFDIVTFWDVVEHVNDPLATLNAALALLKPGGLLGLDTPIRDCAFHRLGEASYLVTAGRYPFLLDMEYSNQCFGHKQIFSSRQLRAFFDRSGCSIVVLRKEHELSFPCAEYLRKLLGSATAARILSPLATLFFALFRVRNKVLLLAQKRPA